MYMDGQTENLYVPQQSWRDIKTIKSPMIEYSALLLAITES
jgi:hypothetical protein